MKKAIYCYNIDDVDQHILETITAPMNIELGLLDDGMLKMTVEEIWTDFTASETAHGLIFRLC